MAVYCLTHFTGPTLTVSKKLTPQQHSCTNLSDMILILVNWSDNPCNCGYNQMSSKIGLKEFLFFLRMCSLDVFLHEPSVCPM